MVPFVWRTAVRRGLLGGNRAWFAVFAVIGAVRVFRRLAGSEPDTVFRSEVKPGEALLITHYADQTLGDAERSARMGA